VLLTMLTRVDLTRVNNNEDFIKTFARVDELCILLSSAKDAE
jgi:hypothetical protein